MKKFIKKLLVGAVAILPCIMAFSACSPSDNNDDEELIIDASLLRYEIVDGGAVVCGIDGDYSEGKLTVPSTVSIDGVTYPVSGVECEFNNCNVTSLVLSEGIKFLDTGNNSYALYYLNSIVVPNSLEEIYVSFHSIINDRETWIGTFNYNEYNGVKYIGNDTNPYVVAIDADSNDMTQFSLHKDTKCIAPAAFVDCDSLVDVTIPDNIVFLGDSAFSFCDEIKTITIPESVKYIGFASFDECNKAEKITLPFVGLRREIDTDYEPYKCFCVFGYSACPQSLKTIELTSEVNLPENAFHMNATIGGNPTCYYVENVILPDTLVRIGDRAFENMENLKNVTIPNSVTTIGEYAFSGCKSLTSVTVPDSVTTISEDAFSYCESLKTVVIPNSVTTIGDTILSRCPIESLTVPFIGETKDGEDKDISYLLADGNGSWNYPTLKSLTITNDTSIGKNALRNCNNLESLSVPFIGERADSENNAYLGYFWGGNSRQDNNEKVPVSLKNLTINSGTKVSDWGCWDCQNITTVSFADTIVEIGERAFNRCSKLTTVNFPNGLTTIGEHAFSACKINELTIPNTVTTIGDSAFSGIAIRSLTIPASVKNMGESVFSTCYNLTTVTIEYGAKIGRATFAFCDSSLTRIDFTGTIYQFNNGGAKTNWDEDSSIGVVVCSDGDYTVRRS